MTAASSAVWSRDFTFIDQKDLDHREAYGFLAGTQLSKPSNFSAELMSASEVDLNMTALEILSAELYNRGPAFGKLVDHDFREACGFLEGK